METDPNGLFGDRMVFQKFFCFWILEFFFFFCGRKACWDWNMAPLNMCPDKFHQLLVLILIKSNLRDVFLFTIAALFWQYLLFLQYLSFIHCPLWVCLLLSGCVTGWVLLHWAVRNSIRRLAAVTLHVIQSWSFSFENRDSVHLARTVWVRECYL